MTIELEYRFWWCLEFIQAGKELTQRIGSEGSLYSPTLSTRDRAHELLGHTWREMGLTPDFNQVTVWRENALVRIPVDTDNIDSVIETVVFGSVPGVPGIVVRASLLVDVPQRTAERNPASISTH